MCVRKYEYQVPYGVIKSEGGFVIQSMVEKPTYNFFVNAGIYVLSPELIRKVKRGTRVDMPTLLEQSIQSNGKVTMFPRCTSIGWTSAAWKISGARKSSSARYSDEDSCLDTDARRLQTPAGKMSNCWETYR